MLDNRYRPEEFIRTIEIDDGETGAVLTPDLTGLLDKWIAGVLAGFVNLRHPYSS